MQSPVTRMLILIFGVMFLVSFGQEASASGWVSAIMGASKTTLAGLGGMNRELVYHGEFSVKVELVESLLKFG